VSAAAFKDRLRADLKAAMQARDSGKAALLRTLIAALDNAEAVEVEQKGYVSRPFGDPSGEVARRALDAEAISTVLAAEATGRLAAASDYERHGRADDAKRLRGEAALVESYAQGLA
jgi:uncharacterized protein YqeY